MERKVKHLEMIQGIINRLAGNSFLIKGWAITLTSALLAVAAKTELIRFAAISLLPIFTFWIVDGYYLFQERLFRKLFNVARKVADEQVEFDMSTKGLEDETANWWSAIMSPTLKYFYGTALVTIVALLIFSIRR